MTDKENPETIASLRRSNEALKLLLNDDQKEIAEIITKLGQDKANLLAEKLTMVERLQNAGL